MIDAPYSLIRNIRQATSERVSIAIFRDNVLVRQHIDTTAMISGVPFNMGDTVKIMFTKGCQGPAPICDIIAIHPVTGAQTLSQVVGFTEPMQKTVMIYCFRINRNTGVTNVVIGYELAIMWTGGTGQAAAEAAAVTNDFNTRVLQAEQEAAEGEQSLAQELQRASAPVKPVEPARAEPARPAKAAVAAVVEPEPVKPAEEPEREPEHKPSPKKKARKWPHSQ